MIVSLKNMWLRLSRKPMSEIVLTFLHDLIYFASIQQLPRLLVLLVYPFNQTPYDWDIKEAVASMLFIDKRPELFLRSCCFTSLLKLLVLKMATKEQKQKNVSNICFLLRKDRAACTSYFSLKNVFGNDRKLYCLFTEVQIHLSKTT